jgi:RNA polymerase sigma-70 factor (ECF subfamily)
MDAREEAIERLYRERYARFRDGLATITGSYDTAHDVVQDAFAQALVKRRGFREQGSLEGWVWRIAFRLALRERRRGLRRRSPESADPAVVSPERDPELAAALQRLPARKRLIVFLHYFADLSYGEIARVCAISEGTVAASLAQARSTLRETLEREEVSS